MHPYLPSTLRDLQEMLREIGVGGPEELFDHIPSQQRLDRDLELPGPLNEPELMERMRELAAANREPEVSFLGGGAYRHYIPSVVRHLTGRSEFYTAYTPYQPEISQGTLQAMFEYQTLMCMLTGMEVSNASLYDGASAVAEAALMAARSGRRGKTLLSGALNPQYRAVVRTYLEAADLEWEEVPFDERGVTDPGALEKAAGGGACCVVVQSPNYFGVIEELDRPGEIARSAGGLLVAAFTEPLAFGLLRPPGELGADITCGEGQSLGIPLGFGGPYLGILTCRKELLRIMPGRIVGRTVDLEGRTAYVLTLSAREQHIRREKATSNICTNQGLCALAAAVYLCSLGREGLRELALVNLERARSAGRALSSLPGVRLKFPSPFFNEFVIETGRDGRQLAGELAAEGILCGIPLAGSYPGMDNCLLVTATEMNPERDIALLAGAIKRHAGKP
ncbi:MAG: aminomethyl-transferring glycine dehydrogenase subunit GcvPA [Spirochaetota bacterium]